MNILFSFLAQNLSLYLLHDFISFLSVSLFLKDIDLFMKSWRNQFFSFFYFATSSSLFQISHSSTIFFTSIVISFFFLSFFFFYLFSSCFFSSSLCYYHSNFSCFSLYCSYIPLNISLSSLLLYSSQFQDCGMLATAFPKLHSTSVLLSH